MTDNNVHHLGHIEQFRFPLFDSARTVSNAEHNRVVFDTFDPLEPYLPEVDGWRSMPLRLAHSQAAGWYVECGPFDLDAEDVERLRTAVAAFDRAVGR